MARSVITKGCKTTTGGEVLTGVGNVPLFNTPITQIGTQATCPKCKKGIGTIHPIEKVNFHVDYIQVALEGDIVMCGCPQGTNLVIADKKPMRVSNLPNGHINVFQPFDSGNVDMSAIDEMLQRGKYAPTETQQASQAAQAAETQSAPTVNPQGQHWPPYDYTKPEGEKNIQVNYTQPMNSSAVMSAEEAHEFLSNMYEDMGSKDTLGDVKDYGLGIGKGTYDAVKTAQGLGGLGVQAYTKNINGKDWVIIKNFRRHEQTLMRGNKWGANNPKVVKAGLGLDSLKGTTRFVKINVGVEFIFAVGINAVDYILNDETTLAEFVGNSASDFVKGMISVAGGALAVMVLPATATVMFSGLVFVGASFAVSETLNYIDDNNGYTDDMTKAIEDVFE